MIIDTHCHYNLEPLFSTESTEMYQMHFKKAQEHGVGKALIPGTDYVSSERALQISESDHSLWAAIGFHPHEAHTLELGSVATQLSELLTAHPKARCIAIGETGLDYFRLEEDAIQERNQQQAVFVEHIHFADTKNLPLSIHVRDHETTAYDAVIELLKKNKKGQRPCILHCVSGSLSYVKAALELGAYISFAGNVSYKSAENIREILLYTPIDRILVETDAPYLPPQEYRGSVCEPWMIQLTVEHIKKIRGISEEQLSDNTYALFPEMRDS